MEVGPSSESVIIIVTSGELADVEMKTIYRKKYTLSTAPTSRGVVLRLWGGALFLLLMCASRLHAVRVVQAAPPTPEVTFAPLPVRATAGGAVKFEHLSLEQGLSQSSVLTMRQDRQGFMWFGTEDGLNRYDGYTFKVYKHEPQNVFSLSSGAILHLYEDPTGMLWVLTGDGCLNRYDPTTERFYRYAHDPDAAHSWSDKAVWRTTTAAYALHGDADGTLWLGTYGGGLVRYVPEADHFIHYRHDPENPRSLSHDKVYTIYRDTEGRLWLGTAAGLNRYDAETDDFTRYPYTELEAFTPQSDPRQLSNPYAKIIHQDRAGDVWVATLGGLNKFNPETGVFTHYRHNPDNDATLTGDLIRVLFEDSTGKFWLVYWDGGVDVFDPRTGAVTRYQHDPEDANSLSDNHILQIHEDARGWIWLVTAGRGVDVFERETGHFIHYQHDPNDGYSLGDNAVASLYEDATGIVWLGTAGRGISRYDHAWRKFSQHRVQITPPDGAVDNTFDNVGNNIIFGMTGAVPTSGMWIGTRLGLNYWERRTDTYTLYAPHPGDTTTLSRGGVWAVHDDGAGTLWVATNTGLDKATITWPASMLATTAPTLTFTHVLTQAVRDIYAPPDDGGLWLAKPDAGLVYFDPQSQAQVVYTHDPDNERSLLSNRVAVIAPSHRGGCGSGRQRVWTILIPPLKPLRIMYTLRMTPIA